MKANSRVIPIPAVSIIIPVFNKVDLTVQCLDALHHVTKAVAHEILVVDNGSTDGTPERVRQCRGNIRLLRNEANRGFAIACNQGAAAAQGKNLLFLNNDTIPLAGWLEALADELRSHPEVVAAGSKLLYENRLIQHAGVAFERKTRSPFLPYRLLRSDDPRVNHRRELQAIAAACVLIRAENFRQCGGFHEGYINGYEDLDLCLSLRKAGGVIVYQPKSVLLHLESQTPGRRHHDNQNRALFFKRWQGEMLSDEDAFYFEDGARIRRYKGEGEEMAPISRFVSEEERAQWASMARAQNLAISGKMAELAEFLAQDRPWPKDATAHAWVGTLGQRLGRPEISRRHYEHSLALQEDPEVRLQAELNGWVAELTRPTPHWENCLVKAHRHLASGNRAEAREQFEAALVLGSPPGLALPGMARAAEVPDPGLMEAIEILPRINADTLSQTSKSSVHPAPEKLVSIIILAHNQLSCTQQCLASIEKYTPQAHELVLVDNGSTDGTDKFFQDYAAQHRHARVILNRGNLGFAAGNNQGLACAQGNDIILLNNDTVVAAGWLENMRATLARHPDCGLVGPVSNYVSGPQLISVNYSDLSHMPAFAASWGAAHAHQSSEVPRLVGFCLMLRRVVLDKIGGLDSRFGAGNFEDDDFCLRAVLAGFKLRVAFDSFVHHTGNQTFKAAKIDYRASMQRNWELFKAKWGMPQELAMDQGYRVPAVPPADFQLQQALPQLAESHSATLADRCWIEKTALALEAKKNSAKPVAIVEAPCGQMGRLWEARELARKKQWPSAWAATLAALALRPYHPEAYLLLGEIAQAAGAADAARRCAKTAREMAPDWAPPRQFLKNNLRGNAKPPWLKLPPALADGHTPAAPRVSVCLIAKNEERFLAQCLRSVKAIASQIIVVDTGSADRTVEIAKEFGAETHLFPWCDDFSAARNAALEHATGDWILILDADEELLPDKVDLLAREIRAGAVMGYRLPIIDHGREDAGCNYVQRLFRNAPGLYFVGRIHEQVFSTINLRCRQWGLKNTLGQTALLHHGYDAAVVASRHKMERNLRLLELAVEEMPGEPTFIMNLGLELVRSGQLEAGLERYWETFRLISTLPESAVTPEGRETLLTQLSTHLLAAKKHADLVQLWQNPFAQKGGLTASQHFCLGVAHLELKQFDQAAEQMRQCLAKRQRPTLSPVNAEIFKAGPHHCLAMCLWALKDAVGAMSAFEAALAVDPASRSVRFDLARFHASHNRVAEGIKLMRQLLTERPADLPIWTLGGALALSQPEQMPGALEWTATALQHFPDDQNLVQQRAEALLLNQDVAAALPYWRRVLAVNPRRNRGAVILCELLSGDRQLPFSPAEEPAISQEVVQWYRQCIRLGAHGLINQLHDRIDNIRLTLPTFVRVWEAAHRQARLAAA